MAESVQATEAKLRKLGERIRAGYAELHPAKQEHLDAVRNAVAEQQRQKEAEGQQQLKKKATETKEAETEKQQHRHRHSH